MLDSLGKACRERVRCRSLNYLGTKRPSPWKGTGAFVAALRTGVEGFPRDVFDLVCLGCGLSTREAEVAALLVQGVDTSGIARRLYVSEHTVYDHVKAILAKTGVRSRRELVATIA